MNLYPSEIDDLNTNRIFLFMNYTITTMQNTYIMLAMLTFKAIEKQFTNKKYRSVLCFKAEDINQCTD